MTRGAAKAGVFSFSRNGTPFHRCKAKRTTLCSSCLEKFFPQVTRIESGDMMWRPSSSAGLIRQDQRYCDPCGRGHAGLDKTGELPETMSGVIDKPLKSILERLAQGEAREEELDRMPHSYYYLRQALDSGLISRRHATTLFHPPPWTYSLTETGRKAMSDTKVKS